MKPKKKNPQDATRRDVRAAKWRDDALKRKVEILEWDTEEAFKRIRRIEEFLSFHSLKTPKRSKRT